VKKQPFSLFDIGRDPSALVTRFEDFHLLSFFDFGS
jgi:hypothetical protein